MKCPGSIVVGYDGSGDADIAVQWSAMLASALGAELRIVHAVGLLEHAHPSSRPLEEAARQLAVDAGLDTSRVHWKTADGESVAVLCREAAAGADLVVVGNRGTNAHPGVLLGSTSMALVERASIPVVVVPRPGA